jgi:hypothetical protein
MIEILILQTHKISKEDKIKLIDFIKLDNTINDTHS